MPQANARPPAPRRSQSSADAAALAAAASGDSSGSLLSAFGQEQEQQQEQEQEQEKEQQQQQQKEQEQEVEEPETAAKEKYAREEEHFTAWPLAALGQPPSERSRLGFYPASEFAVHRTVLEKRGPLHWPPYLQLSANHTHPRWRFSSHHRLKNMLVFMEWMPAAADASMTATPPSEGVGLSDTQRHRLHRLRSLPGRPARVDRLALHARL